jgi:transcriptional regulator with XRE-family HTH domain
MRNAARRGLDETDPVDAAVGERIRVLRLGRGMDQSELAASIGASTQDVQMFEAGARRVGAARLARIAKALGVGVGVFFAETATSSDLLGAERAGLGPSRSIH